MSCSSSSSLASDSACPTEVSEETNRFKKRKTMSSQASTNPKLKKHKSEGENEEQKIANIVGKFNDKSCKLTVNDILYVLRNKFIRERINLGAKLSLEEAIVSKAYDKKRSIWKVVIELLRDYQRSGIDRFSSIGELTENAGIEIEVDDDFKCLGTRIRRSDDDVIDACLKRAVSEQNGRAVRLLLMTLKASPEVGIRMAISRDLPDMLRLIRAEDKRIYLELAASYGCIQALEYFLKKKENFIENSKIVIKIAAEDWGQDIVDAVCKYAKLEHVYKLIKILFDEDAILLIPQFFLSKKFECDQLLEEIRGRDREGKLFKIVLDQMRNFLSQSSLPPSQIQRILAKFDGESKAEETILFYPRQEFNGDEFLKKIRQDFAKDRLICHQNKMAATFIGVVHSTANYYLFPPPYHRFSPKQAERYFRSGRHPYNVFVGAKFDKVPPGIRQKKLKPANLGLYRAPLDSKVDSKKENRAISRTVKKDLAIENDSALYNRLLIQRNVFCRAITSKYKTGENDAIRVGWYNHYPCLMVLVKIPPFVEQPDEYAVKGWVELIISYFVGLVNYHAQRIGLDIELVRRSSFCFLTSTIAPCGKSFRLNIGIIPVEYANVILRCLRILNDTLVLLQGNLADLDVSLPENCFIYDEDYVNYLNKKGVTDDEKHSPAVTVKNLLDLIWCKIECGKHGRAGAFSLMRKSVSRDSFSAEVYEKLVAAADLNTANSKVLYAGVFLDVLRWSFSNWNKPHVEGRALSRLSFLPTKKITLRPLSQPHSQIIGGPFWDCITFLLTVIKNKRPQSTIRASDENSLNGKVERAISTSLEAITKAQNERDVKNVYYYLQLLNELLYCDTLANFTGNREGDDGFGSDSEEEDNDISDSTTIFCMKLIVQNGMRAILSALEASLSLIDTEEDNPRNPSIYIHSAYYEVLKILESWPNFERVYEISAAEILILDANACVTSEDDLGTFSLEELPPGSIKVLVVDVTSATTTRCNEFLKLFASSQNMKALFFVSSSFKNEQIGADKNPYGTVRIVTKDKRLLKKTMGAIKKNETPIRSNIAHHYRRYMKSLGATLTNFSIFNVGKNKRQEASAASSLSSSSLSFMAALSVSTPALNQANASSAVVSSSMLSGSSSSFFASSNASHSSNAIASSELYQRIYNEERTKMAEIGQSSSSMDMEREVKMHADVEFRRLIGVGIRPIP